MADGDGPAVGVHVWCVIRHAQGAQGGDALCGKGFVQLDHVHLVDAQPGAGQYLVAGGDRANAHDTGFNTGR